MVLRWRFVHHTCSCVMSDARMPKVSVSVPPPPLAAGDASSGAVPFVPSAAMLKRFGLSLPQHCAADAAFGMCKLDWVSCLKRCYGQEIPIVTRLLQVYLS